jgi:UDP-3-O-[3-hydroxymyristoyl] glucosamine N-acyltransferase
LTIGAGAKVAAQAGIMRDIEPGTVVGGSPAVPIRQFHKQTAWLAKQIMRKE